MNHEQGLTAEEIKSLVGPSAIIVEAGSHDGSDTAKLIEAMPDVTMHCFEPDERPIKRFKETIGDNPRVTLYEVIVSDVDGFKDFYASTGKAGHMEDWDYSGSPCKPTGHLERSPEISFKPPISLPSIRLDSWLPSIFIYSTTVDLIRADLQGSQRAFIDGATITLSNTRFLYIECHEKPLYEGEPTQDELQELLPSFELLGIYERDNLLLKNRKL